MQLKNFASWEKWKDILSLVFKQKIQFVDTKVGLLFNMPRILKKSRVDNFCQNVKCLNRQFKTRLIISKMF